MSPAIRIGTRGSDLALVQARRVAETIRGRLGREVEIVVIETSGDRNASAPIEAMGEIGVFTREIERALLAREIDVAVHSLKDLPTLEPEGLAIAAIPERADPRDALVARAGATGGAKPLAEGGIDALRPGARVGTSSRRRRAQVEAARPDLVCLDIRGNVPTRVEKCRRGDYDAVVLAAAGLDRLGLVGLAASAGAGGGGALGPGLERVSLPIDRFLPAPGQGALAIETRAEDAALYAPLDDPAISRAVRAERELLRLIEGGCSVPLGAHARLDEDGRFELRAALAAEPLPSLSSHATLAGGPIRIQTMRQALVRAATPEAAAALALRILRPDPPEEAPAPAAPGRLAGRRIVLTREDPDLAVALLASGGEVRVAPAIEVVPVAPPPTLPPARWILLASRNCVAALRAAPALAGVRLDRVGAIGPATAEALARAGIAVDLLPDRPDSEGLAEAFLALGEPPGTSVLLPGAADARPVLRERLAAAGYDVRPVTVYETRRLDPDLGGADVVVFASPSAVRATGARVVAIGPATAEAARGTGLEPVVAERPTARAMFEAVARASGAG